MLLLAPTLEDIITILFGLRGELRAAKDRLYKRKTAYCLEVRRMLLSF